MDVLRQVQHKMEIVNGLARRALRVIRVTRLIRVVRVVRVFLGLLGLLGLLRLLGLLGLFGQSIQRKMPGLRATKHQSHAYRGLWPN